MHRSPLNFAFWAFFTFATQTLTAQNSYDSLLSQKSRDLITFLVNRCDAQVLEDSLAKHLNTDRFEKKLASLEIELYNSNDTEVRMHIYSRIASTYIRLGETAMSKTYILRAIESAEKINNHEFIGWLNAKMGSIARLGSLNEDFEPYYQRALEQLQIIDKPIAKAESLYIMALLSDDKKAITYLTQGIELLQADSINSDNESTEALGKLYNCIGYYLKNDKEKLKIYQKSIYHSELANDSLRLAFLYNNVGYTYFKNGDHEMAIPWYIKALNISVEAGFKGLIRNSLNNLALAFYGLEEWQTAFKFEYSKAWIHGSVLTDSYNEVFAQNKVKYELDKSELQNTILKSDQALQKTQNLILIGISLFLVSVVSLIFYSRKKIRTKNIQLTDQAKKLSELDQVKSRFFANISHELKTPLSLIKIPVEVLLNQKYDQLTEKDVREKFQIVARNSNHLQELIDEILDLAKLEAGKIEIKKSPVLLKEMLELALSSYTHRFQSLEITLHTDIEFDDQLTLNIDHSMLSKIVHNLLSNALKFTPKGGLIQLKSSLKGRDQLELIVKDSGAGIHPEDLPKIFSRFYQSERPESKAEGGTGIGLALCKELVELQDGTLEVKSELGKGSEFKLLMPVEIATESAAQAIELLPSKKNLADLSKELSQTLTKYRDKFDLNMPKLVIAEDHYEMQQLLHEMMRPYFEITLANNGHEALEVMRTTQMDLLISDLMMPIMDGYELLTHIKNEPNLHRISIIMLTARSAAEDKLKALNFGIDDYITKPFDQQELILRVLNLMNNRIKLFEKSEISQDQIHQTEKTYANYKEHFGISEREFEVLQLMKARYSNAEIADKLFVSISTIKFHLHNIFNKLDVAKRKDAHSKLENFEDDLAHQS